MSQCFHEFDPDEACKHMYFSMALTKAWDACINSNRAKSKICICVHCYNLFKIGSEIKKHTSDSNHNIVFLFNPFSLYCIKCKTYIKCSDKFIKYAALALRLTPSPPLKSGFHNLGSTCFSSSVLVALSHCRPIVIASCVSQNPFCRVFAASATRSRMFNRTIHDILSEFPAGSAADAAEFLSFLLSKLAEDGNVSRVFDGKIAIRRYCRKCGGARSETQSFVIAPVPLADDGWVGQARVSPQMPRSFGLGDMWPTGDNESGYSALVSVLQHGDPGDFTLERCLGSSFLPAADDCPDCGRGSAVYFQTVEELPEVLVLQLERFGRRWFGIGKFHQYVSFPSDGVDFGHFVPSSINCGPSVYDLQAVISHTGFLNSGHYVCYARSNGKWLLFDDSAVREVCEKEVLGCQAYLLFYTKRASDEVSKIRENLENNGVPWDIWVSIATLSNPYQWEKSIIHSEYDSLFEEASLLAEAGVLRERTPEDIRAIFSSRFPLSNGDVYVSQKAVDVTYNFMEGDTELPNILESTGDISVGSGIVMFESLTK